MEDNNILKLLIKELVCISTSNNINKAKYFLRKDEINEKITPSLFINDMGELKQLTKNDYSTYIEDDNLFYDEATDSLDSSHKYKNLKFADFSHDSFWLIYLEEKAINEVNLFFRRKKIKDIDNLIGIEGIDDEFDLKTDIEMIFDRIFRDFLKLDTFDPKDEYQEIDLKDIFDLNDLINKRFLEKYNNVTIDTVSENYIYIMVDRYNRAEMQNIVYDIVCKYKIINDQAWNDLDKTQIDLTKFNKLIDDIIYNLPFIDEIQLKTQSFDSSLNKFIIYKFHGYEYVGKVEAIHENQLIIIHLNDKFLFQPNLDNSQLFEEILMIINDTDEPNNFITPPEKNIANHYKSNDIIEINIESEIITNKKKFMPGKYVFKIEKYKNIFGPVYHIDVIKNGRFEEKTVINAYIIHKSNSKLISTLTNMPIEVHESGIGIKYKLPSPPQPPQPPLPPLPPSPPQPPQPPQPPLQINDDVVGIHFNGKPHPTIAGKNYNILVHGKLTNNTSPYIIQPLGKPIFNTTVVAKKIFHRGNEVLNMANKKKGKVIEVFKLGPSFNTIITEYNVTYDDATTEWVPEANLVKYVDYQIGDYVIKQWNKSFMVGKITKVNLDYTYTIEWNYGKDKIYTENNFKYIDILKKCLYKIGETKKYTVSQGNPTIYTGIIESISVTTDIFYKFKNGDSIRESIITRTSQAGGSGSVNSVLFEYFNLL